MLAQLDEAIPSLLMRWGLAEEMTGWGIDGFQAGAAQQVFNQLFKHPPVEWNRLSVFQDVTMRCIAQWILPAGSGPVYVHGELSQERPEIEVPRAKFHLYCSSQNAGALSFVKELARDRRWRFDFKKAHSRTSSSPGASSTTSPGASSSILPTAGALQVIENSEKSAPASHEPPLPLSRVWWRRGHRHSRHPQLTNHETPTERSCEREVEWHVPWQQRVQRLWALETSKTRHLKVSMQLDELPLCDVRCQALILTPRGPRCPLPAPLPAPTAHPGVARRNPARLRSTC